MSIPSNNALAEAASDQSKPTPLTEAKYLEGDAIMIVKKATTLPDFTPLTPGTYGVVSEPAVFSKVLTGIWGWKYTITVDSSRYRGVPEENMENEE